LSSGGRATVDAPRRVAYRALRAVSADGAYANLAVAELLAREHLSGREAAFVTELVFGACRWQGTWDRLIEAAAKKLTPLCRLFGIGQNALLPLLVGLLLGVTYGAGTIAELNRVKPLSERDMALLGVFLFSCHGIIETTYLFTLAGGNVFFLSAVRLAIAVGITALAARILPQTFRRKL